MDPTDGCGDARPLLEKMQTQSYTHTHKKPPLHYYHTDTYTFRIMSPCFSFFFFRACGEPIFILYDPVSSSHRLMDTRNHPQAPFIDPFWSPLCVCVCVCFVFALLMNWLAPRFYFRDLAPITSVRALTHACETCQREKIPNLA